WLSGLPLPQGQWGSSGFISLPPVFAEVLWIGPELCIQPVGNLLVIEQIIGEQMQGLSLALELLTGLHGQCEQVGFVPITRLEVEQYGDPAGVEVADTAQ